MRLTKRMLAAVTAGLVFLGITASVSAQEKPQAPGEEQPRIALAEKYLFDYYKKSRSARKTAGVLGLGGGALLMGIGAALMDGEDDWLGFNDFFGGLSIVTGGIMVVGGAVSLVVPSPAESAYSKIQPIQDPVQREKACADALAGLARGGRRGRMIGGGLTLLTGAILAAASGDDASADTYLIEAVAFGSLAAFQFLVKSKPEKIYRAYLKESQVKAVPQLSLGFGPHGRVQIGLSLDF